MPEGIGTFSTLCTRQKPHRVNVPGAVRWQRLCTGLHTVTPVKTPKSLIVV